MLLAMRERSGISEPLRAAVTQLRTDVFVRQSGHVDARAFARVSGITAGNVAQLRRAGRLPSILGLTDGGKVVPLLPVSAAERSRSDIAGSITAEDAAKRIGCTYRGVEELVRVGLLTGSMPTVRGFAPDRLRILTASFDELVETLAGRSATPGGEPFDVPLIRATWTIGGRLKPWSAIFDRLMTGILPSVLLPGSRSLSERIMLRSDDAYMLNVLPADFDDADPRFDGFMSKTDAFSVLNTEARFAKALSARWRRSRGVERAVPVLEVLDFAGRFISLREIAALTGVTASASAKNLARHGASQPVDALHDRAGTLAALGLHRRPSD
jgi:hypothetical protein